MAERERLTGALRERGLDVADSQANFVWLALGDRTLDVVLGQSLDTVESLEQIVLMPAEGSQEGEEGQQGEGQLGEEGQPQPA